MTEVDGGQQTFCGGCEMTLRRYCGETKWNDRVIWGHEQRKISSRTKFEVGGASERSIPLPILAEF